MKYHQLVPVRAVNALSDWLVFNLEELGVEAPLVYSRLLLSLLHTTFNITSIEQAADIPYFKEFISLNSKYNSHHHQILSQLDIEELKKFAAVNLLIDATTTTGTGQGAVGATAIQDQDNSTIIALVNELYKKIRAIEKENSSSASTTPTSSQTVILSNSKGSGLNKEHKSLDSVENLRSRFNDMKHSLETCTIEDVTKKYYSAFPALDKELITCTSNNIEERSNFRRASTVSSPNNQSLSWSNVFNKNSVVMNHQMNNTAAATKAGNVNTGLNSLKRKSKRKRAGKTRSFYINRKPSSADDGASLWDMNFEGNWEMGQDLISDFVMNQQNYHHQESSTGNGSHHHHHHKRNRSISEGDFPMSGKNNAGHRKGNAGHHNKHNKAFYERQRTFNNNNNEEDVQDLYHKGSGYTKEDVSYHLPTQLLPSENPNNVSAINFQFNSNVVNAHKTPNTQEKSVTASEPQQQDYMLQLKTKFDKIKAIWDDVQDPFYDGIDTVDAAPARNVWEPLNEPVTPYYDQMSIAWASVPSQTFDYREFCPPKQQLETEYDFIKCGTNLQTSIWSNQSNVELETRNADDTLHCREIFDQASDTDSCYFSSLNTTLNANAMPEKRGSHISLSNHSEHSMFTEVVASKKGSSNNLLSHVSNAGSNPTDDHKGNDEGDTASKEDENLLTSDKTHFRPIAYPDGYTFDISNNLDDVKFYRSESGSLFLDQEQYMELRMDHMRDEFYGLNNLDNDDEMRETDPDLKFVVKFCVRQNEKCCQTDEQEFDEYDTVSLIGQSFPDTAFDHFRTSWRYSEQILCDTRIDFSGDTFSSNDDGDSVMSSKCIWSNAEGLNNNNGQTENHRLWETCNTCQDTVSFPANRLLKDELHADGEEILSDLNYFQSLIIGNDWNDETINNEVVTKDEEYTADNLIDRNRVYQKVDKFVHDLLKPETTKTLAKALDTCNADWENVAENDLLPFAYLFNCQNNNNNNNSNASKEKRRNTNHGNLSDDEKVKIKQDQQSTEQQMQKAPPDKNRHHPMKSSVNFLNLCNYIDAELWKCGKEKTIDMMPFKLIQLQNTVVRNSRLERKRRHSACKNLYNYRQIKLAGYDFPDAFCNDEKLNDSFGGYGNNGERLIMIDDGHANSLDYGIGFETEKNHADLVDGYNFITKYWATDASIIFKNNNLLLKQIDLTRPLTR